MPPPQRRARWLLLEGGIFGVVVSGGMRYGAAQKAVWKSINCDDLLDKGLIPRRKGIRLQKQFPESGVQQWRAWYHHPYIVYWLHMISPHQNDRFSGGKQ